MQHNVLILRRRKLGRTSCREMATMSQYTTKVHRNDRDFPPYEFTHLVRWGCTGSVPGEYITINTAAAIHEVNDKAAFRRKCADASLSPWTALDVDDLDYSKDVYPVVVRPRRHSQGRNLHVCYNEAEAMAATRNYTAQGYYISSLVSKVAEYRVFVVQGRAVAVAKKTPGNPDDVAWNVAQGGRFDNVRWGDWDLGAVRVALDAFELSSLDFGGVDVMVDADGIAYVLEINSAPSLTSPYRQRCMTLGIDYIIAYGKERIPYEPDNGYRGFIHPAVLEHRIEQKEAA